MLSVGNSVYASDVHAAFARSTLGSIFITSPPPARNQPREPNQPRAKIPKPAVDVDAFLELNATDKTPLALRLQKRFKKKKKETH